MLKFPTTFTLGLAALLVLPQLTFAAYAADISIVATPLTVSPSGGVMEGQAVRLYASVQNLGDHDLIGTVKFYADGTQIGVDQPVSVKKGSVPDDVFLIWKTVAGNHKIAAQLYPYETAGDNPANNYVETTFFVDADTDRDGVGNRDDVDDDNDGLKDVDELRLGTNPLGTDTDGDGTGDKSDVFPRDPTEQTDFDQDNIGDNADTDDDNDGLSDEAEARLGTNQRVADTDGDGAAACNDLADKFPLEKNECLDTDADGVGDHADAFPTEADEQRDTDKDGTGDNADTDKDNDGYCDNAPAVRGCQLNLDGTVDAFPVDSTEHFDADKDGKGDNADQDDDNDGTKDTEDAFPLDPNEQRDSDKDGLGDNADTNDQNMGPVIRLSEMPERVYVGKSATFDASATRDPDGDNAALKFTWDFGDGTPAKLDGGATAEHTFTKIGEYEMQLTVTDGVGEGRVAKWKVRAENPPYIEELLLWLLLLLLLLFLYIFWRTVQKKRVVMLRGATTPHQPKSVKRVGRK